MIYDDANVKLMIITMTPGNSCEERTWVNLSTTSPSSLAFLEHDGVDHKNNASNNHDVEYNAKRNGNDFMEYNDNKSITF